MGKNKIKPSYSAMMIPKNDKYDTKAWVVVQPKDWWTPWSSFAPKYLRKYWNGYENRMIIRYMSSICIIYSGIAGHFNALLFMRWK